MDGYDFTKAERPRTSVRWAPRDRDGVEMQLAVTGELTETAYRIRHEAYISGGFIEAKPDGMFSDNYDAQGNSRLVVVFRNGMPAGTVRVARHDPSSEGVERHPVPAMAVFGAEIREMMDQLAGEGAGSRIMEICRLARLPAFERDVDVLFAMFRAAAYLFLEFDAGIVFNAARTHHMPMYRRLGFRPLVEPRLYPGLTCSMGLMGSFPSGHSALIEGQPFMRGISRNDTAYRGLIAGRRVAAFGDMETPDARPDVMPTLPVRVRVPGEGAHIAA